MIRLPERAKALPPTGFSGRAGIDPSYADCQAWADETAASNIGLRLSATEVGIDKDCWDGKTGDASIAAKEAEWGPLPKTWRSTSRGFDTGNGIWLYRIPEGVELTEQPLKDVEIIQRHHRYVVCWPSIHPNGQRYEWLDERTGQTGGIPSPEDLPYLPTAWVEGLRSDAVQHSKAALDTDEVAGLIAAMPTGPSCHHVRHGVVKVFEGSGRHDGYRQATMAVIGAGRRGCPGAADTLQQLHRTFVADVTAADQDPAHRRTKQKAEREWAELIHGALSIAIAAGDQGAFCVDDFSAWVAEPQPRTGSPEPDAVGADPEAPHSWLSVNLGPILDGTYVPEVPDLMVRSDGLGLLYRGRVHSMHAESESGKSLLLQWEAAQRLNAGQRVAYLDFESDAESVTRRVLDFGADPQAVLQRFDYRHPEVAPGTGTPEGAAWQQMLSTDYALIVLDGVTEAMDILAPRGSGVDLNERIAGWMKRYPKRLAESTGAAVVLIDHVVKNSESRGRHAIGGQHKMAGLTGAAYTVEVKDQPRRGHVGVLHLNIGKDRPGGIRPHCGPMLPDRTQLAAVVRVDSTGDRITLTLQAPSGQESTSAFRPTVLMERVSRWLEAHPGEHSRTQIGKEVQGKTAALFTGLDVLVNEGFVKVTERQRGTLTDRYYSHVSLFTEAEDDLTIPTVPPPFPDHSRNGPIPEPDCTVPTVPTPSKGNGGRERSRVDRGNSAETAATVPATCRTCGGEMSGMALQCAGCGEPVAEVF